MDRISRRIFSMLTGRADFSAIFYPSSQVPLERI
jgi:hypothetical protein